MKALFKQIAIVHFIILMAVSIPHASSEDLVWDLYWISNTNQLKVDAIKKNLRTQWVISDESVNAILHEMSED